MSEGIVCKMTNGSSAVTTQLEMEPQLPLEKPSTFVPNKSHVLVKGSNRRCIQPLAWYGFF